MPVRPNKKEWLAWRGTQGKPQPLERKGPTARETTRENGTFLGACRAAGVEPTVRQARKWLARTGRWARTRALNAG